MFVPAAGFALAHLLLIPKSPSPVYQFIVDERLPVNAWRYLEWTAGATRMDVVTDAGMLALRRAAAWIIIAALAGFSLWRLSKRDRTPVILCGWFVLLLAPMLPLPNHVFDYYLTVPGIGLAWLAGWGLVQAWRSAWLAGSLASGLALFYAAGCVSAVDIVTQWHLRITSEIRIAVRAVEATVAKYPGTSVALLGMDDEVFLNSAPHRPFELVGAPKVWLAPGWDEVTRQTEAGDLSRYRTSYDALAGEQQLRVLDLSEVQVRDVTEAYREVVRAEIW
jgi:hypothetical protein